MITTLKVAQDSYVRQTEADSNFGQRAFLVVSNVAAQARRSLLYATRPFPLGATIVSATLKLWTREAWNGGPTTITCKRVTQAWKEARVTYTNAPSVVATNAGTVVVAAATPANTLIEIDLTDMLADVAGGVAFHGFQLSVTETQTNRLHSSESDSAGRRPILEIEWSETPDAPVDLKPSGAQIVSLAQPTLSWTHVDTDGEEQAEFQVQIDNDDTFASTLHDSGFIASDAGEYDLASTAFSLTDATTYYWRVRTKDAYGLISAWSAAAQMRRDTKGTVTITSPVADVDDLTPAITWTFTGETQEAVRLILLRADDDTAAFEEIYNTGAITTTDTTFTIPEDLIEGAGVDYRIRVDVWDTEDRIATPGDPRYATDTFDFAYVRSGTPAAIETLTVEDGQDDDAPGIILTWTRTNTPDYFAIKVDDKILYPRLDPSDHLIAASTWSKTIYGIRPRDEHDIEVEAVVLSGGKRQHSDANPVEQFTPQPKGVWLLAPDYGPLNVAITGKDPIDKRIGESGETFFPIGRRDPVRIRDITRGYEGTINGQLAACFGRTGQAWRARLENLKGLPTDTTLWLVYSDNAFRVKIGEPTITNLYHDRYAVSIDFWQVDDFTVRLRRS